MSETHYKALRQLMPKVFTSSGTNDKILQVFNKGELYGIKNLFITQSCCRKYY